jgi:hypothetical protein
MPDANSIASTPQLSRDIAGLSAALRQQMRGADGRPNGGDSETPAAADRLDTLAVSSEGRLSFELQLQQSTSVTEIRSTETAQAGGGLMQDLAAAGLNLSDGLQQSQQDAGRLIDTLTAFLQGLKGDTAWTPQAQTAAAQRQTTITQREETTSLFLRVDIQA